MLVVDHKNPCTFRGRHFPSGSAGTLCGWFPLIGSVKTKAFPSSGLGFTHSLPPFAPIIAFEVERPSPVPLTCFEE